MNRRQFVPKIQNAMMVLAIGCLIGSTCRTQETTAPTTPPTHGQHNSVKPAIHWKMFHYTCVGGQSLSVYLAGDLAKVLFENHQYLMKQTRSADGNRYSDGKVLWWGRGDGGFLQQDTPDGDGAMLAKDCKLDKKDEQTSGVVTGTVAYLQRMALPANAVIEVKLQEVSQTNAPAKVIAEQSIPLGDRQVPVPFELKFDPKKIDPQKSYALSGRILVNGVPRFASEQAYPVLTLGHASPVDIILKPVRGEGEKQKGDNRD